MENLIDDRLIGSCRVPISCNFLRVTIEECTKSTIVSNSNQRTGAIAQHES